MSPVAVIRTIEALLPQIVKSGNAEDTLLKYARANNLAPEQLKKMATTLNTARSLAFMENNPDLRGATIPLLDPVKLAAAYTQFQPPAPAVKKASSVVVVDGATVPNFFKLATAPAPVKEAMVHDCDTPKSKEVVEEGWVEKQACAMRNIENVQLIREEAWEQFDEYATKLAKVIREKSAAHGEMREDVAAIYPVGCSAFDHAAGLASQYLNVKLAAVQPTKRYVVVDRHEIVPLVKLAQEQIDRVKACDKLIAEFAEEGQLNVKYAAGRANYDDLPPEIMAEMENLSPEAQAALPPRNGPSVVRRAIPNRQGGGQPSSAPAPQPNPAPGRPQGARAGNPGRGGGGGGGGGAFPMAGEDKDDGDKKGKPLGDQAVDFAGEVAKMIDNLGRGFDAKTQDIFGTSTTPKIQMMLGDYAPGKRQMKIDRGVQDVRTVTNLQRLILADPILQEADPEKLVGIFNDLQQDDPTIGQNMNKLRFALREALQYDGAIPIQTSKALADLDKTRMDAQLKRTTAMQNIYGQ